MVAVDAAIDDFLFSDGDGDGEGSRLRGGVAAEHVNGVSNNDEEMVADSSDEAATPSLLEPEPGGDDAEIFGYKVPPSRSQILLQRGEVDKGYSDAQDRSLTLSQL